MKEVVAKRDSNMELLRIIAMLFVMFFHTNVISFHGTNIIDLSNYTFNSFIRVFWELTTLICVDTFVLLSGWYGIRPNRKKTVGLIFQVFFFLVLSYLFDIINNPDCHFSIHSFSLLFLFNKYWFFITYLFLILFAPILNTFIERCSKKTFLTFLICLFTLQTFYGYIQKVPWYDLGASPVFFFFLYMLARYVRLYQPAFSKFNKYIDLSIFLFIIFIESIIYCYLFQYGGENKLDYIVCYLSPLVIIDALFFLLFFSKLHFSSRIINWIAVSSFAAYLLHASQWDLYIDTLNRNMLKMDSTPFVLFYFIYVFSIFMVSILIDKVRIWVFNKIYQ